MKKIIKIMTSVFFTVLFCGTVNGNAFAAETTAVIEAYTEEDKVVLYVSGIEGEVQEVFYQIGNTSCEVTEYQTIGQHDNPIYTLIIWDNSLSVMNNYEDVIKEILSKGDRTRRKNTSVVKLGILANVTPLEIKSNTYL